MPNHIFDLEKRTLIFTKNIVDLINKLPKNPINQTFANQIIRSAGSVGANYREANDSLGKKDFFMRIKICRKEAKETSYWLELILHNNPLSKDTISLLLNESIELTKIFSSIAKKFV